MNESTARTIEVNPYYFRNPSVSHEVDGLPYRRTEFILDNPLELNWDEGRETECTDFILYITFKSREYYYKMFI